LKAEVGIENVRKETRIQTIRSVLNPDKLVHLGAVADPWAVAQEVKEARRFEA